MFSPARGFDSGVNDAEKEKEKSIHFTSNSNNNIWFLGVEAVMIPTAEYIDKT